MTEKIDVADVTMEYWKKRALAAESANSTLAASVQEVVRQATLDYEAATVELRRYLELSGVLDALDKDAYYAIADFLNFSRTLGPSEAALRFVEYAARRERAMRDAQQERESERDRNRMVQDTMKWLIHDVAADLPDDHPLAPLAVPCPICGAHAGEPCHESPYKSAKWIIEFEKTMHRPDDWASALETQSRYWPGSYHIGMDRITLGVNPGHNRRAKYAFHGPRVYRRKMGPQWLEIFAEAGDTCPHCGAKPGEPCVSKRKLPNLVHYQRRNESKKYIETLSNRWWNGEDDMYPDGYEPPPTPVYRYAPEGTQVTPADPPKTEWWNCNRMRGDVRIDERLSQVGPRGEDGWTEASKLLTRIQAQSGQPNVQPSGETSDEPDWSDGA